MKKRTIKDYNMMLLDYSFMAIVDNDDPYDPENVHDIRSVDIRTRECMTRHDSAVAHIKLIGYPDSEETIKEALKNSNVDDVLEYDRLWVLLLAPRFEKMLNRRDALLNDEIRDWYANGIPDSIDDCERHVPIDIEFIKKYKEFDFDKICSVYDFDIVHYYIDGFVGDSHTEHLNKTDRLILMFAFAINDESIHHMSNNFPISNLQRIKNIWDKVNEKEFYGDLLIDDPEREKEEIDKYGFTLQESADALYCMDISMISDNIDAYELYEF